MDLLFGNDDKSTRLISIYECLTLPNPKLRESLPKSNKNTTSEDFLELDISQIEEWSDFTFKHLYAAFSDLLSMKVERKDLAISEDDSQCDIWNEEGVDYVMDNYSTKILRKPIKIAAEELNQRDKHGMYPLSFHGRRSGYTIANPSAPDNKRRSFKPDWVIYERDLGHGASVIGDSKLCHKWRSSDLRNYHNMSASQARNFMLPLRQIVTYCREGATDFGFLITTEELVVINLHQWQPIYNTQGKVRYRSIKWSEYGPGRLTVHLGIWFLLMVAIGSRDCMQ